MRLIHTPTSPFVRKVLVLAQEGSIASQIDLETMNPWSDASVADINPIGKVPALITDDQTLLVDSKLICEYLISTFGLVSMLPADLRFRLLNIQAIADGLLDATVQRFIELNMREQNTQSTKMTERFVTAIKRTLGYLEQSCELITDSINLGSITTGVALAYLDIRYPEFAWRAAAPRLTAWFESFDQRPSMVTTAPPQ